MRGGRGVPGVKPEVAVGNACVVHQPERLEAGVRSQPWGERAER
jgi:hypothetical protein